MIGPCATPMNSTAIDGRGDHRQRIEGEADRRHQQRRLADAHRAQPHDRPGGGQRHDGGDAIDDGGEDADQLGIDREIRATAGIMTLSDSTLSEIITWMASMLATGTKARFMSCHPRGVGGGVAASATGECA